MISNACATMRTAMSFFPLLRPFIIKLCVRPNLCLPAAVKPRMGDAPVNQSLNDGHLRLLELLLGVTASSVGEVDGMADLDVIGQGDILNLNTNWMQKQSNDLGEYTNCPGIG